MTFEAHFRIVEHAVLRLLMPQVYLRNTTML